MSRTVFEFGMSPDKDNPSRQNINNTNQNLYNDITSHVQQTAVPLSPNSYG